MQSSEGCAANWSRWEVTSHYGPAHRRDDGDDDEGDDDEDEDEEDEEESINNGEIWHLITHSMLMLSHRHPRDDGDDDAGDDDDEEEEEEEESNNEMTLLHLQQKDANDDSINVGVQES